MPAAPSATPHPSHPDPSPFREGQRLADCLELRRRVSGTGPCEVWLAHDEVLGKEVSLHFVPAKTLGDPDFTAGLRQDVKRNRQLIHPSILRVYELIEGDGWVAISMDSFAGRTLASCLVEKGASAFGADEAKALLHKICAPLADAHRINLNHGRLTPENVLIDDGDRVLLAGFGSSFRIERRLAEIDATTNGGTQSGATSASRQKSTTAPAVSDDVFAVGVLLYQLLAGGLPRNGLTLSQQRRELAADLPPVGRAWDQLASNCLAENPTRRPDSIAAVMSALDAAAQGSKQSEPVDRVPAARTENKAIPRPEGAQSVSKPASELPVKTTPEQKSEVPRARKPAHFVPMNLQIESRSGVSGRRSGWWTMAAAALVIAAGIAAFILWKPGADVPLVKSEVNAEGQPATKVAPVPPAVKPGAAPSPPEVRKSPEPEAAPSDQSPASAETPGPVADSEAVVPVPPAPSRAELLSEEAAGARAAFVQAENLFAERQIEFQTAESALAKLMREIAERTRASLATAGSNNEETQREKLEVRLKVALAAEDKAKALLAEKETAAQNAQTGKANAEAALAGLTGLIEDQATAFSAISKAADELSKIVKKRTADFDAAMKAEAQARTGFEETTAKVVEARQAIEKSDAAQTAKIGDTRSLEELNASLAKLQQNVAEAGTAMDAAAEEQKRLREELAQSEKAIEDEAVAARSSGQQTGAQTEEDVRETQRKAAAKALSEERSKSARAKVDGGKMEDAVEDGALAVNEPSGASFVNSLGMKFISVGEMRWSVWPTRYRDYERFALATDLASKGWRDPGFRQGPDHPAVMVSWEEAMKFCQWLTGEERRLGLIKSNQSYRLPTDAEWSEAVGLSTEKGNTPETRDMSVPNVYPWGSQWPPAVGAGNYTGSETESDIAIRGYVDGFAWTSPVGSFSPNAFGLFDMGGNVWEWCLDNWNAATAEKVLRGGSWFNGDVPLSLLSSCRVHAAPDTRTDYYGFRVVLARNGGG